MIDEQHDLKVWLSNKLDELGHGAASSLAKAIKSTSTKVSRMKIDSKEPRKISPTEIRGMAVFFRELPPGYEDMKSWLGKGPLVSSFDEDDLPPEEIDPDWDGTGGGYIDGRIHFDGEIPGSSPEFSSKPGMGQGQHDDRTARLDTGGISSGHPVINEWYIPPDYVRNALDASPSQVAILGVIGHSMQPLLNPNDRVMVDVSQNTWVGDAVYVIDELDGVMQVKTLRRVSVKPPVFEVVSESDPTNPKIRNHDQIRIVGRVVGRFTRM